MDTLMSLHKHLNVHSLQYLSHLISKLDINQLNEQALFLSALLTKNLWLIMLDIGAKNDSKPNKFNNKKPNLDRLNNQKRTLIIANESKKNQSKKPNKFLKNPPAEVPSTNRKKRPIKIVSRNSLNYKKRRSVSEDDFNNPTTNDESDNGEILIKNDNSNDNYILNEHKTESNDANSRDEFSFKPKMAPKKSKI